MLPCTVTLWKRGEKLRLHANGTLHPRVEYWRQNKYRIIDLDPSQLLTEMWHFRSTDGIEWDPPQTIEDVTPIEKNVKQYMRTYVLPNRWTEITICHRVYHRLCFASLEAIICFVIQEQTRRRQRNNTLLFINIHEKCIQLHRTRPLCHMES